MLENNKLIAEFMGRRGKEIPSLLTFIGVEKLNEGDIWYRIENAKFHTSWDWIMPVIEKIESLGYMSTIEYLTTGKQHRVFFNEGDTWQEVASGARDSNKLQATYQAVVNFIEWYNKNKKI